MFYGDITFRPSLSSEKVITMTDSTPATILIVDDHPLLRKVLRQLIAFEDELEVIGEASDGKRL
jgi:two-component system nitrate/nitrite response regulator NarL